jgi:hypothetical protein
MRLRIVLLILHLIWTELFTKAPNLLHICWSLLLCFLPERVPKRLHLKYLLLSANFKIWLLWFFERTSFLLFEKWLFDGLDVFLFLESKKLSQQLVCLLHCFLLFFSLFFLLFF